MIIAVTGHRPKDLDNDYTYTSALSQQIMKRMRLSIEHYKPSKCITGMALGVDTMWALMVLKCHIPLVCAIPCKNQDKMWPKESREIYKQILTFASETVYITDKEYTHECMQLRNVWMVENCDLLLGFHKGTPGGTANCIKYAKQIGKRNIIIDPSTLHYDQSPNYVPVVQHSAGPPILPQLPDSSNWGR